MHTCTSGRTAHLPWPKALRAKDNVVQNKTIRRSGVRGGARSGPVSEPRRPGGDTAMTAVEGTEKIKHLFYEP
ncbi:hypothetical protein NTGM5_440017 [Candidatus Nitrotoga sp. M5]|nr:hypothetical protein NTGM5_440017 [Candidatus Nitrotoga sp. M5]